MESLGLNTFHIRLMNRNNTIAVVVVNRVICIVTLVLSCTYFYVMIVCWFKVKAPTAPVLEFFNVATVDELTMMNGCSRKKAEVIIKMRPFDDWDELVWLNVFVMHMQLIVCCGIFLVVFPASRMIMLIFFELLTGICTDVYYSAKVLSLCLSIVPSFCE